MKEDEIGRACSTYGRRQERNASKVLVGKRKIQVGRPNRRWKDEVKMDIK
jgi:hypothetical protein